MNKLKPANRLLYNKAIIEKLSELVEQYPDWRFGQLLINTEILECEHEELSEPPFIKDPFYEESRITWERMCNNKICFN